eukprot:TRINITY_DN1349_c0_g2_i1.p1 TRINITY_DN1349_c0_g2~~TRINITY_DN1349_c0_g2_i1.p1  ORF type:complete len:260 (+),score=58.20 TRINITY_DN1349_c0_g2_i1:68-847(+)
MMLLLARGTRVVTRREIVDTDHHAHPAGSAGVVWEVLLCGAVVVCLDRAKCEKCLAKGRADDFDVKPLLRRGTDVACMPMVVKVGAEHVPIPRGTRGVVRAYDACRSSYSVDIHGHAVRVNVPAWRVQPVVAKVAWERRAPSECAGGSPDLDTSYESTSSISSAIHSARQLAVSCHDSNDDSDAVLNLRKRPARSSLSPPPGKAAAGRAWRRVTFSGAQEALPLASVALPPPPKRRVVMLSAPQLPEFLPCLSTDPWGR